MNIAKPPDENLSSDQFDFIESLGNGEKIKCDIETVQGRLTATNVFKADGNFILMPHNHAYNYKSPMMSHGNRQGQKTFLSYSIDHISSLGIRSVFFNSSISAISFSGLGPGIDKRFFVSCS